MIRFAKRNLALALCLGLAVGATACAKKTAENPAATTEVSVTGVDLGRSIGGDKRVTERADQFGPNDVIYASVLTSGTSPSAILKARWTYEDGQLVDEAEQAIAPAGVTASEFHVSKPDGWPVGKYRVEVYLNGTPAMSKEFQVK